MHETSLIDLGNYNDAYPRMAGLAEDWLARYPSIQMVLDVHRDSLETDDGAQLALRADVDGEACAKLLLVMGSNGSGLEHPGWRQNLANAARLQALCEQRAPGLMRDLLLRASRYNQHLTPRSMLLEVGTGRKFARGGPAQRGYFLAGACRLPCSVRRDRTDLSEI